MPHDQLQNLTLTASTFSCIDLHESRLSYPGEYMIHIEWSGNNSFYHDRRNYKNMDFIYHILFLSEIKKENPSRGDHYRHYAYLLLAISSSIFLSSRMRSASESDVTLRFEPHHRAKSLRLASIQVSRSPSRMSLILCASERYMMRTIAIAHRVSVGIRE